MNADLSLGAAQPACPPLYQASVYQLPDLAALERISTKEEPGFIYARDDHPNARLLEAELARLEGAAWALVAGSGMAALNLACLALVGPGDRLVVSDQLYGRTTQFVLQELPRFGVVTEVVDTLNLEAVAAALARPGSKSAKLLLVETITNPLVQVTDLPALAKLCERHGTALLVDNTFATPLLCRPLELGATFVMESLTKALTGHSDVTLGVLAGNGEQEVRLRHLRSVWGFTPAPFECWLAQRSLATAELRIDAACANAATLAEWLPAHAGVRRVCYPLAGEQRLVEALLDGQGGTMLSFELAGHAAADHFLRHSGIPFCPSLGDAHTTVSYPFATSHRYVPAAEKHRLGITEGLLRLSVGIEPAEGIMDKMRQGLA